MKTVVLKGGGVHYSLSAREVWRVSGGTVLLYLMPVTEAGDDGRRLFLAEMSSGSRFPGFAHSSELFGKWRMGIVALDRAEILLEDSEPEDGLIMSFAKTCGIKIDAPSEYEVMLIEKYERVSVKEKGYIYAVERDEARRTERTLSLIRGVFDKDAEIRGEVSGGNRSGRLLYDAAAYICEKKKIRIAELSRIQECCGKKMTVSDIARVSHFVVRDIVLEAGWHKRDNGAVLAYRAEDKSPIACIPKGPSHYVYYDPKSGKTGKLTDETAKTLSPNACMFYRPFPEKEMYAKDLLSFGMKEVFVSDLVRVFVFALIGTLIGLLIPYLNEQAFDKFIPIGHASGLVQIGIVMLSCMLGNAAFTVVKNLSTFRSMNSMEYAAQAATFDRLFNLPESFFRQYDAAELGQKAMGISQIYNVLAQTAITAALSALFSVIYLFRMIRYSKAMALWGLLFIVLAAAAILWIGFAQVKYEKQKLDVDVEVNSRTFQFLNGISKIRNAWAEDRALLRYFEKYVDSVKINAKKERMTLIVTTLSGSLNIITSIIFYFLMIRKNIGLSIGAFSGFMAAYGAFSGAIITIVQNFLTVNQVKPLYDDAKPILTTLPEISEDARVPGSIDGEIEVSNVTFSYDPEQRPVLDNLSLHIKPGEYIGIVGSSGCGKSTLLKLLLGFERPQRGRIYYDSRDIDELDKRELRKLFGVVLQDGGLITGSIYDNITITAPGTRIRRVEETIREVGLEEDIRQMPMGLHTVVSEGAGQISGGQRQRILIARAIVGKPKVIFLDEATSALDNVTQSQVVETLEKLEETKVVIAHRLSTVKNCDRIIVMDQGRIAEEGTYEELMERHGLFYGLAIRQIG